MQPETRDATDSASPMVVSADVDCDSRTQGCITHLARNPFVGPLSKKLWEQAHSVPSQYHDTFDYGSYDRLYERFGDHQPRGGVVYKGTLKFLEASNCLQCFHRFEIDTYGRGCLFNCAYCYAKSYLSIRGYWNKPMPFPIDIAAIRQIFATVFETSRANKFRPILEKRVPL